MSEFCDKIIYQTYECSFDEMHLMFQENSNIWKSMHADWQYKFSNAEERKEEICKSLNLSKEAVIAYDRYKGIVQSDIWRFVVTNTTGGIYADLDSIPTSSANNLINNINNQIDLITMPITYDAKGPNTSNFILRKNSKLGAEINKIIYEHLEMCGFLIKTLDHSMQFDIIKLFHKFTNIHSDSIQMIYTEDFVRHSNNLKPPSEYRDKIEEANKKSEWPTEIRLLNFIDIYTERWNILYNATLKA